MLGPSVFLVIIIAYSANAASISEELECPLNDYSKGEQGKYFEGDMMLSTAQMDAIMFGNRRNGLRDITFRWPNATVVYHIEDHFNEKQVKMIKEAMNEISSKSCVKFRPQENDEHAVIIQNLGPGSFCSSCVGYRVKEDKECVKQTVNLADECFIIGVIMHELLHTIGFYHMQSSYDRDDYVKICDENIQEGMEHNFKKYSKESVTTFGVPYDYDSLMHYRECAFSKNGKRTIIPRQENVTIGQRIRLSKGDIIELNRMYDCKECEEE